MLFLCNLAAFAALVHITTFLPIANAFPTSFNPLIPRTPDSLSIHSPRQDGGIVGDIIMSAIWGIADAVGKGAQLQQIFGKLLGDHPTTCCTNDLPTCRFNAGKTIYGHGFYACFYEGDATITDADVDAMKCMINLHHLQGDKCIDFAGSTCANGYPGGGLMDGKMHEFFTHHLDDRNKVSAQDSQTLQAAAESMRGKKIDYAQGGDGAISVVVIDDQDGALGRWIDFAGHPGDDC